MSIRRGDVVSHSIAVEWGVGKVVEVSPYRVSIEFCDGTTRKIACSHFTSLLPAAPALFIPISAPPQKAPAKAPRAKKVAAAKQPAAKQPAT
ncbi:MAG TPA: DUF3553 domain-containing protein [Geobacter sp.]|nr:DUF3553 domain-containing protein [Geobacter sp.]